MLCIFLVTIPHRVYDIPLGLEGTQKLSKKASVWLKDSEYFENRINYYDPFFIFFMGLNPYDKERVHEFVYDRDHPENKIEDGEIVIWDAHFSPNEGGLPLENLMHSDGFRLIHLTRDKEPFTVLGGYLYEIYIFHALAPTMERTIRTSTRKCWMKFSALRPAHCALRPEYYALP